MSARKAKGGKIVPLVTPWNGDPKTGSVLEAAVQRGTVTREEALAVWDRIMLIDEHYFDGYPRDQGRTGPFGEDERCEIISEAAAAMMRGEI